MVEIADLIGAPFADGGRGPVEFDCWGLACEVWRRAGVELRDYHISCEDTSRIAAQIDEDLPEWIRCAPPWPVPALVVMRFNAQVCNHVGVHVGNGMMLHTDRRRGAHLERMDHPYWRQHIEGIYVPGWL